MPRVCIIGPGRVGGALAIALSDTSYAATELVFRNRETVRRISERLPDGLRLTYYDQLAAAEGDIFIIAVPDSEIGSIGAAMAARGARRVAVVLHVSGSLSAEILAPLRAVGSAVGSMHPLISISDAYTGSKNFDGAFFCIEGDPAAVAAADAIARALGAVPFTIETRYKALYHAAAVTASGHMVALVETAVEMLAACGLSRERAKEILLPLIASTLANLRVEHTADALTGPFARGDEETLKRHIESFNGEISSNAIETYLSLAERSLQLAESRGLDPNIAESMRQRIGMAKRDIG